jgi:hypothetical protein
MHGILTLYDQIKSGEIMRRRGEGHGAGIQVDQRDGVPVAG